MRSYDEVIAGAKAASDALNPHYLQMSNIVQAASGRPLTMPQQADFGSAHKAFREAVYRQARGGVDAVKLLDEAGADPERAVKAASDVLKTATSDRMTFPQNTPIRSHGSAHGEAGEVKALKSGDKLADRYGPSSFGLSDFVRAAVSGDWSRLPDDAGIKALSLADASGGYLVPAPLSAQVIDRVRNASRVQAAGAVLIPMESSSLRIARLATDPVPGWKVENALIAASDPAFEAVELKAKTLAARLVMSVELAEDSPAINDTIEVALAGSLAVELDRAALFGTGTPPQPRGLKNTTGVQTLSAGANGAAAGYAILSNAVQLLDSANATAPYGVIYSPRTAGTLDRLVDSTGQPLNPPDSFRSLERYVTAQVPNNLAQGTSTTASDAFVGDWSQFAIGMRTSIRIEATQVGSNESGLGFASLSVLVRAWMRCDFAVLQPSHFVVISGLI